MLTVITKILRRIRRHSRELVDPAWWGRRREDAFLAYLSRKPRYSRGTTKLLGKQFEYNDPRCFSHDYREIFAREIYWFSSKTVEPLILDCGANTGLGVIYAKRLYPAAKVIAFEADPDVFEILERNTREFALNNVELNQKAVWKNSQPLQFYSEGSDAGRVNVPLDTKKVITVPAIRLRDYLEQPVDFLKLDIEGAETEVLVDAADRLSNVRNLFVEYHSFRDKAQDLAELLKLLQRYYRLYVENTVPLLARPFEQREAYLQMDLQLNIFGTQPAPAQPL